jgi:hypothetical protein
MVTLKEDFGFSDNIDMSDFINRQPLRTGYRLDPGGHTDLRMVSLEPVWPEGVQHEKNFPEN